MNGKDIHKTRMSFSTRCELVNEIKGNSNSKYTRHGGEAVLVRDNCDLRENETQTHCLMCPKLEDIRQGLDFSTIKDIATFFQPLIVERVKLKNDSRGAIQVFTCIVLMGFTYWNRSAIYLYSF